MKRISFQKFATMISLLRYIFLLLLILGCGILKAQELKQVSIDELNALLNERNDKTKIVNIWATWCVPCIQEMPHFLTAQSEFKEEDMEFIFVSIDFQSQTNNVVSKINSLGLHGVLLQLNEKGNEWIDKFDKVWEGAIPYTLMVLPDLSRKYHYSNFETYSELKTFISTNLSNNN